MNIPQCVRFLSFQLTGHLVWVSVEPQHSNMGPKRVPNCAPDADYGTYVGVLPMDINVFWREFKQYRLQSYVVSSPMTIDVAPLPAEFVDEVKLARAKCYASQLIHNQVNWNLEKNGLYDNPVMDPNFGRDDLVAVHMRHHNISQTQAEKLVQFKIEEHQTKLKGLRTAQIEAELAITDSTNVADVISIFNRAMKNMAALRSSEALLTRFL